ncbi:MAG: hypothetical protein PHN49_02310 [Candidatus Omnitrophica bacterium]|nr:hypothetical protein [Candidatus Omnitrophota bacterium]MDD5670452.1 hypothetical protein [Candidatus Omnitrophota bacterium]
MKRQLLLSIIAVLMLSSCTRYDIRPILSEQVPDAESKWGVYRNGYLIPEYTTHSDDTWAQSKEEAKQMLRARKRAVAKILPLKYQLPRRYFVHDEFFTLMLLEGPIQDILVFMPVELIMKMIKPNKTDFVLFPVTRLAYGELFYGPTYTPDFFTRILPENPDWAKNDSAQNELRNLVTGQTENKKS